jgi:hypothetical protein
MPSSPPEVEQRDVLLLGSGEAGKYIAWNLAASGKKTALIERRYIGGSCPNVACLPVRTSFTPRRSRTPPRWQPPSGCIPHSPASTCARCASANATWSTVWSKCTRTASFKRHGAHPRHRAIRRSKDHRGRAQQRRHPHPLCGARHHQHWLSSHHRRQAAPANNLSPPRPCTNFSGSA